MEIIKSNRHKKFIDMLYNLTYSNECISGAKVGACVVYKRKMISYGFNQKKSHTLQAKYCDRPDKIYLHAEIDAIRKALYTLRPDKLKHCYLYIIRIRKNGDIGLCKPCKGCKQAINAFGLYCIYTDDFNHIILSGA